MVVIISSYEKYIKDELEDEENIEQIISDFRKFCNKAKMQDIDIDLYIGCLFYDGENVEKNYIKAKKYFEKSAMRENAKAMNYLGLIYNNGGEGIDRDRKKAREYFENAAKLEYPGAMFNLGCIYLKGIDVEKDYKKAIKYFEMAAKYDYGEAILKLGDMYYNGEGVEKNYKKAKKYYEKIANCGYESVKEKLKDILCKEQSMDNNEIEKYKEKLNDYENYFNNLSSEEEIVKFITSLDSDDKKIEAMMEKLKGDVFKALVIATINDEEKRKKCIDDIKDKFVRKILEYLVEDDYKEVSEDSATYTLKTMFTYKREKILKYKPLLELLANKKSIVKIRFDSLEKPTFVKDYEVFSFEIFDNLDNMSKKSSSSLLFELYSQMSELTEINCKKFCVTINNSRNSNQDIISELYYFLEDNYIFSILIDNFNVKISYERNHLYFKFGSFIEDYNKYLEVMDIIYRMFKDLYNEGKLSDIVFDDEKKNDEISLLNAIYKDKEEFEEKKIEFYERVEKLESVGLLKYLQKHDNRIFEFLKVLREYVDDNKDTFEKDYDPNFIDESKIIISEKKLKYIYADKKNSDVVMIKFVNNNDDFNSIDAKCLCEYFVEESCNECCIHTYSLAKKILEKYDYNKKM